MRRRWTRFAAALLLMAASLLGAVAASAQTVSGMSPGFGPVGSTVTFSGTGFGNGVCSPADGQAGCSVVFSGPGGSAPATIVRWSDSGIVVRVPSLAPGPYHPLIRTGSGAAVGPPPAYDPLLPAFEVTGGQPVPPTLSPRRGSSGTPFVITGGGFGSSGKVLFCQACGQLSQRSPSATITSWSPTEITGVVPQGLEAGTTTVQVVTSSGSLTIGSFTVETGSGPCADVVLTVGSSQARIGNAAPQTLPVAPRIRDGRIFVPLRFVSEVLGASIYWDAGNRQVTIRQGGHTLVMTEGRSSYTQVQNMNVAPFVAGAGYTLVPVRFAGQALGVQVTWIPASRQVVLTPPCPAAL